MFVKDFIKQINNFKKKYPEAIVIIVSDTSLLNVVTQIAVGFVSKELLESNSFTADDVKKQPEHDYEKPVIFIG